MNLHFPYSFIQFYTIILNFPAVPMDTALRRPYYSEVLRSNAAIAELFHGQDLLISYSVIHNFIAPSKELCSKMALGEVGVSLP